MRVRSAPFVAVLVALLVVAAVVLIGQIPGGVSDPRAGVTGSGATPSAEPSEPDPSEPDPSEPDPPDAGSAPLGPFETNAGGQEAGPSTGTDARLPFPSPAPRQPLISAPLPPTASVADGLVRGFPTAVISVVPGSTVLSSSVASEGSRVQVGLTAMSTSPPAEVLAHYGSAFAKLGLVATPVPVVTGSTTAAFVRDASTITVTVTSAAGGSRYTVFGVLVAGI